MKTLLRIDSSPRQQSTTRALTDEFEESWTLANPEGVVVRRDLGKEALPFLTEEWIAASYTPEEQRTAEQRKLLAKSDELIDELLSADEIVIGSPMWNFGVPASMKAYIDLVARAGKTFRYGESGPVGFLQGKRLVVITARGGSYIGSSPAAKWDLQEPYLRQVFQFLGMTDIRFVHAENQGRGAELAAAGAAAARGQLATYVQRAAELCQRVV
jgi:FMN-dependent NADH-azoreductase